MQLNQGDKAIEALHEAVNSRPDKPTYYFHLARAYQMTNAPAEARKALERSKVLGLNEEMIDPLDERDVSQTLTRNCPPVRNYTQRDPRLSPDGVIRRRMSDGRRPGNPTKKAR